MIVSFHRAAKRAADRVHEASVEARKAGDVEEADRLLRRFKRIDEAAKDARRLSDAEQDRRARNGLVAMLDRIDDLKAKGRLDAG